ncbi:MAG: C1 family peptidase [Candidatus Eremiobacteraeota bacterium]|nr:C1 family peptidase [Candidatus Eremiobacteraeota bacterium]
MNKSLPLLFIFLTAFLTLVLAQPLPAEEQKPHKPLPVVPEGALTRPLIDNLRGSFTLDAPARSAINAVSNNNIRSLSYNRSIVAEHNNVFSHKIETGKITSQNKSGRCWLFAALNLLRPRMMKKYHVDNFEFSQNYLFFWDKMEKANLFLETIIATRDLNIKDKKLRFFLSDPFADGGQWNYAVALIKKYGLVPRQVMEETANTSDSSVMDSAISTILRKDAAALRKHHTDGKSVQDLRAMKEAMLRDIYRMLAICLGVPPSRFELRYEDKNKKASAPRPFTPLEFYEKEVAVNLDDYFCLYSSPTWKYNCHYMIDMDRNMVDKPNISFVNLQMQDFKAVTLASLLGNEPVWFGADVDKDVDRATGIMAKNLYDYSDLFGVDFSFSKEERILYGEATVGHAMVFAGVDIVNGKPVKWLVENSWGKDRGNEGFFTIYDDWFDENVFQVIIQRRFLSVPVLNLFKTEPVALPEDDPLR